MSDTMGEKKEEIMRKIREIEEAIIDTVKIYKSDVCKFKKSTNEEEKRRITEV
jgi:hypothetical protein